MIKVKTNPMKYKDSNGNMIDVGGVIGKEVTDLTLTKSNVPADSKTVGDKLNQLSQEKVDQADAVLVIPQTLTDDQKAQARTNIGAASEADKITFSYDAENKIVRFLRAGGTLLELPSEKVGEYYKLLTDTDLTAAGVPADAAAVGERFDELSQEIYQNGMAINELSEGVGELSEKVNNYTETLLCTGAKTTLTLGEDYNVGDTLKFECLSADADFVEIFCATSTEGNFESITIDPTSDETAYVTVIVEDDMLSFTVNKVVTVYRIYSKVLIDSELSEESTNPVQNKVVAKKITEITNEISQLGQEIVNQQTALETEVTNRENAIADLKAQESQKSPAFPDTNNTVENALAWLKENGDTSKVYLLPDGYIYAYMYTEHQKAAYTNRVSSSIDTDGSIYNDVGYKEGYRLNSSAVEAASDTGIISGFIPYNGESIQVRVKNHSVSGYTNKNNYVWGYDSSFIKADFSTQPNFYGLVTDLGATYETDANDRIVLTFSDTTLEAFKDCKYIRVSGYYEAVSDLAVALGEEISDSVTTVKEYAWTNTGHAFVPTDYEDRINELEEKTEDHETRLEILETGIPSYWLEELETKADSIQQAMESAGWNKSSFLYYTDAHWTAGNSKKSPLLLKYLFVNTSMNKTKFGGDIIGDPPTLTHDNIKHVYDEWRALIKDLNQDSVLGNHDNFHKGRNDADVAKMVYSFLLAPEEKPNRVMGGDFYYYVDEPCEKTRYLHLDSGRYSLSDEETEFIIETLKSTPDGWHIVVISHIWFQYTAVSEPSVGSITTYMQRALDLFDAYNARQSGSITMVSTSKSYDFTSCGGKVEFCMGGHIHIDLDLYSNGGIPVILTASDVNQERSGNETEDSGTLGTITESAVYGIVADYDNNKISVIGVGRGTSRVIAAEQPKVNVLTEVGYTDDRRINSSGGIVEWTSSDADVTGYIPVKPGDIIQIENMPIPSAYTSGAYWNGVGAYTSSKTFIKKLNLVVASTAQAPAIEQVEKDGNIVQFTITSDFGSNVAFIVINAKDITADSKVYVVSA